MTAARTGARSAGWFAAGGAAMLALLAPALWNGFPLMFYDTGAFIDQALTGKFVAERQVAYGWFLRACQVATSLWPTVIVQAALTAWVAVRFARTIAPALGPGGFLALVLALAVGTAMPWYVGQVLPDFLTPLLLLAFYLLGLRGDAQSLRQKLGLAAVGVLAVTAHSAHLGLGIGLSICIGALQLLQRWRPFRFPPARADVRWPALTLALGIAVLVGSNYARTGEVFLNKAGPAHILGRLMQDGIIQRLLEDTCPEAGYKLCAYKDQVPDSADDWLWKWETPFWKLGGFEGMAAESTRLIVDSVKRYPLMHFKTALAATVEQFFTFRTGDGLEYQEWPTDYLMKTLLPRQHAAYMAAHQQKDEIEFFYVNALHLPLAILILVAGAVTLVCGLRRGWRDEAVLLPAYLFTAFLGNAFICGALSNPHDRYQSRILWTLGFALLLLAVSSFRTRVSRT